MSINHTHVTLELLSHSFEHQSISVTYLGLAAAAARD